MPHDPNVFADMVVTTVKAAMAPVLGDVKSLQTQVAGWESRWNDLGALRERVAVVEAKSAREPEPLVRTVDDGLAPVLERVAAAEARLAVLGDLRDRVVTAETKAAMPLAPAPGVDLSAIHERLTAIETTQAIPTAAEIMLNDVKARLAQLETKSVPDVVGPEMASLRERVAVLEVRPVTPGPIGEPGPPGKDGTAGLSFEGVYQEGQTYEKGHLVTWAGSSWHCNATTTTKPGDGSKDWQLMVKRGRDGRDGQDAPGAVPVVSVRRAG